MRFQSRVLAVLAAVLFSSSLFAVNLQNFYFSDSYKYAILEDSFILKHPGSWLLTTSFGYVNDPLVIADTGSTVNEGIVIDSQSVLTLGFHYAFKRWLMVGIDTSFVSTTLNDGSQALSAAQTAASALGYQIEDGSSIGDTTLRAKIRIFRSVKTKTAFAIVPRITFATGSEENFTSSGATKWGLLFVGEKLWTRWAIQGAIGYSQTDDAEFSNIDYDKAINAQFGVAWRFLRDWNLNLELVRDFTIGADGNSDQDIGDFYTTVRWKSHDYFDTYAGAGVAGFNDIDEENYTFFAGLKFHPAKQKRVRKRVPHELAGISDQFVDVGMPMNPVDANYAATNGDRDTKGNMINYTCSYDTVVDMSVDAKSDCTLLPGLYFNTNTGLLEWTPQAGSGGSYEMKISGFVNGDVFDEKIFVITVNEVIASREQEKSLGTLFKADRVYFDNSSHVVKNAESAKLDEVATYLKENESQVSKVIIEGYASKVGPSRFNQELSNARATNVLKYLVDAGVKPHLLQTVAYGDDYLNEEPEHWQNRRVEFRIYNKE